MNFGTIFGTEYTFLITTNQVSKLHKMRTLWKADGAFGFHHPASYNSIYYIKSSQTKKAKKGNLEIFGLSLTQNLGVHHELNRYLEFKRDQSNYIARNQFPSI